MSATTSNKKFGRNDAKCKRYRVEQRREKHKLKRVLHSNGLAAAQAYADKAGLPSYLRTLIGETS